MASGMARPVLGWALLFALWAASLGAGGLLPPSKSPYLMPNGTINGVASGNLSSFSHQLGVLNTVHSSSPTETWCFDTPGLSDTECCGLDDTGNGCKHAAAVCFDQVDCQDGCELDLAQGASAESASTLFSCAVPTQTCATAVTTRDNGDGVLTTSSILGCAASVVTQAPSASNHTGGHVGSSQDSAESSAVSMTTIGNSTKPTTNVLPGFVPTSQVLASTLAPFSSSPVTTTGPSAAATSSTGATHSSPVPTTSEASPPTSTPGELDYSLLWHNPSFVAAIAMGGVAVLTIVGGIALYFRTKYRDEAGRGKEQEEVEMTPIQGGGPPKKKEKKEKKQTQLFPAGLALFAAAPRKQRRRPQKPSQNRGPLFVEAKDNGSSSSSVGGASNNGSKGKAASSSASFNAEIVAALRASETGVLYDRSGDMRCADFSVPSLRGPRHHGDGNNTTPRGSSGGGETEGLRQQQQQQQQQAGGVEKEEEQPKKSSTSFESASGGADVTGLSELSDMQVQEATAVRYYSPGVAGQARQQIVHVTSKRQLTD